VTTDSDIARLRAEFQQDSARVSSESDLQALRDKYLGRKNGLVTALMKSVSSAPPDLKPVLGKAANELKQEFEQQPERAQGRARCDESARGRGRHLSAWDARR
jgi:phenylalanyl-tRNA synthetase alpha chain